MRRWRRLSTVIDAHQDLLWAEKMEKHCITYDFSVSFLKKKCMIFYVYILTHPKQPFLSIAMNRNSVKSLQGFPEILQGIPLNPYVKRYLPPYDEFEVDRCCLPLGVSVVFPAVPGPSIFIVTAGDGTMHTESTAEDITEGDVFFVPAKTMISITAAYVGAFGALELFRAGVNSRFLE